MLTKPPFGFYLPMTVRALFFCFVSQLAILVTIDPQQHLANTHIGKRMVLVQNGISLQSLVPKTLFAHRVIQIRLCSQFY